MGEVAGYLVTQGAVGASAESCQAPPNGSRGESALSLGILRWVLGDSPYSAYILYEATTSYTM